MRAEIILPLGEVHNGCKVTTSVNGNTKYVATRSLRVNFLDAPPMNLAAREGTVFLVDEDGTATAYSTEKKVVVVLSIEEAAIYFNALFQEQEG